MCENYGTSSYVTDNGNNNVSAFSYDNSGTLTLINSYTVGAAPEGVTVDPTGKLLYVSNSGNGSVSAFTIGAHGSLTAVNGGTPYASGSGSPSTSTPTTVLVDPSSQFLYVGNGDDGTITPFTIGAGGVLAQGTAVAAFIGGGGPSSIAIK
jgi:6-phosphogluconolactonase